MADGVEIYFRRGPEARRVEELPSPGEPLWTTDTKILYVGDGVTPGGIAVSKTVVEEFTDEFTEDGLTRVVVLSSTPDATSVRVHLNGLLQREGEANDYTLAGLTLTMQYAVYPGDLLVVEYRAIS
jgi:hypothetical protein